MGREEFGVDQAEAVAFDHQSQSQSTFAVEEIESVGGAAEDLTGKESEPAVDGGDPILFADLSQNSTKERTGGEVLEELIERYGEGGVESGRLLEFLQSTTAIGDRGEGAELLPDEADR